MKTKFYLFTIAMLLTAFTFSANAATTINTEKMYKEAAANMTKEQRIARCEEIKERVEEIKAMDISQLTKADRKELKAEVKELKKEAQAMGGGGIYLSVGAIIIIILVLILIL
ncbi:hypothetical protein D0C36_23200 [Mucilaginibacter conchicola]|uniref:Seryl-tRNA synthetase n=1 Tax=Mucilaginibacter conchicola TaxID=2303333 RepID=A0A372NND2_9SPHI|nr:hypothetical protein [Mucilaginibacter conchicola]RFZ90150.1 hypothetical protein D0C36_23200 [Mucilaginibacter conchicola]